ncbi:MAG: trifunctional transcriptional regulator/proline dehydrogenase/L-glutamate gamma-semialdehyde dehydrogenase [Burkholderiales bacterium]|nr:trifunctional transcriptional regulator/proline dehydrogenase/L-glutamate gamma-semialdehyde dehydrogenase [Burkholderiales bacterium]
MLTPALLSSPLRAAITAATRPPEPTLLPALLEQARLAEADDRAAHELALRVARGVRERARESGRAGLVQGLLQEFALSSSEGVALMCLAEALLRIPDAATRDALIRDKISSGDWRSHLGQSPSLFVNAATWGLLLTGRLVATHSDVGLGAALRRVVGRGGEPLIRKGVDMAMRLMGEQFVTGETIAQALDNAKPREAEGFRYSYDMLGEAAMTARDAEAYLASYEAAIHAIGRASAGRGIVRGPGISIKLSALHPRYSRAQVERVMSELYPRLLQLAELARRYDIGLNIDAEEAERLELSLDLLERLCFETSLEGWNGIGFVIQAYQKRCPAVIDWLVDLGRRSERRLMIRLVKGAYWDGEIKRAQLDGQAGYPVYTRKAYTDVAYIACAKKLLAAPAEIYPQFATHNAHTLAAVFTLAGPDWREDQYEFQCLHGMGEPLYEQVVGPVSEGRLGRPCRIYAPVGTHDTLLAYLVRRLLENGANTSFVNRIASDDVPLEALVENPVRTVEQLAAQEGAPGLPHPAIVLPRDLYGAIRVNSHGLDLAGETQLNALDAAFAAHAATPWSAEPLLGVDAVGEAACAVLNPADRTDVVGQVRDATAADVQAALACAAEAAAAWAATSPAQRAAMLEGGADRLEADTERLLTLLVREAGKTCANAVSEVREAVDFLRYYAQQVRRDFANATHRPLGPVVCISPWNFPLAIFSGQVAAALAAGNPVLAKPAEQTPLVAAAAVRALHAAGVPRGVLQLLPGRGETVGAALVGDDRVQGVLFTGSTEVARLLQRNLAGRLGAHGRPVTLIAETGGQNAMVVDSSALAEQVVADVVNSAFDSAGQRCSALRVLCVQRDLAPRLVEMLEGALRELAIGDTRALAVDVGPVIDEEARAGIERHIAAMRANGRRVVQHAGDSVATRHGSFVVPTVIEIGRLAELEREVFGPVLHVLRYEREDLAALLGQINATGYGLTLGVHTRIDETVAQVVDAAHAGNVYVNRNVVGAVVGVQPFGGEGLSGTGPKAGGPLYLLRLLATRPEGDARAAVVASGPEAVAPIRGLAMGAGRIDPGLQALRHWALAQQPAAPAEWIAAIDRFAMQSPVGPWRTLTGPTGEANLYAMAPREAVLCLAEDDGDRLMQLAAVLAVGSRALWPAAARAAWQRLPEEARERIALVGDWTQKAVAFDAVLHHGTPAELLEVLRAVAAKPGPIVGVTALAVGEASIPLERLVVERSLSINTAAAGGNASLMTMG